MSEEKRENPRDLTRERLSHTWSTPSNVHLKSLNYISIIYLVEINYPFNYNPHQYTYIPIPRYTTIGALTTIFININFNSEEVDIFYFFLTISLLLCCVYTWQEYYDSSENMNLIFQSKYIVWGTHGKMTLLKFLYLFILKT